jgi:glyoxylase-like metal-dependent hydrolase (beta-lactamase superfamily II)
MVDTFVAEQRSDTLIAAGASHAPYRFAVGSFTATVVPDGAGPVPNPMAPRSPAAFLFADAPPGELAAVLREAGLERWVAEPATASVTLTLLPLVIDTGRNRVLVDAGLGGTAPLPGVGQLPASLRAAGIAAGEIDTVVFTHAHPDHVLGALDGAGEPAFPNARYVLGRSEHAYWTDAARVEAGGSDPAVAALARLGSRLVLVDEPAEIVPGVRAIAAPGHTPGHLALAVESGGARLLVGGDAFVHPLHVRRPAWRMVGDMLRAETEASRRALRERAASEGAILHCYHFPYPGLGRVWRRRAEWRWEPLG